MLQPQRFRLTAVFVLAALLTSCATTRIPPISASGASFQPARDERRLWESSREEEKKLREEARIYNDPLLEDYLDQVVRELNPPGMAVNPDITYRVTVIEEPTLNAFAYPHGSIYIHTGLLARMEDEDQLATVLGHEMTHVEDRHMLRYRRAARNRQIGLFAAAVAGSLILAGKEGDAIREGHYGKAARIDVFGDLLLGLGLQLAFLASVNGYGRDLEREADAGGYKKMLRAGYDVRESPKLYTLLLDDHGDSGKFESFFFGNHPRLTERVDSARERLEAEPPAAPPRERNPREFRRRIRPVLLHDAAQNLELGRLHLAEDELLRAVDILPNDPEAHRLLGSLYEQRRTAEKDPAEQAKLLDGAVRAYREAIRLNPDLPEPHKALGILAYRTEDGATACVQFRQYLELAPAGEDAQAVRGYLLELEQDGRCR